MKTSAIVRTGFSVALSWTLAGCSLPLADPEATIRNSCSSDVDCGSGAVCASLSDGPMCVATKVDLPDVILEVRAPLGSGASGGISHLIELGSSALVTQNGSGLVFPFDVSLAPRIHVGPGNVTLDYAYNACPTGADKSFPAKVRLRSVSQYPDLGAIDETVETTGDASEGYSFAADLPPGTYDIHAIPVAPPGCTGELPPPAVFSAQEIFGNSTLNIALPEPRRMTGEISVPMGYSIDGWTLTLVEPKHGWAVSNQQILVQKPFDLFAKLDVPFHWFDGPSPMVRLEPNTGPKGLAINLVLDAVALFENGMNPIVNLTLLDLDLQMREVGASVLDDNQKPVVATVRFQSKKLSGNVAVNASYGVAVETNENGILNTKLPPGEYQVIAFPIADEGKAITASALTLPQGKDCFCGQVVPVVDKTTLAGRVLAPDGKTPMAGASVVVNPSQHDPRSYIGNSFDVDPASPLVNSDLVDRSGFFSLLVDPGSLDLSVRPSDGSGYPWLVRSRITVQAMSGSDVFALDDLRVSFPAMLIGTIRDPSAVPIPGTVIKAWLPVKSTNEGGGQTGTVIQIAETISRSDGTYLLPLAPSISQ